jgi:uncharacterized membrane protein
MIENIKAVCIFAFISSIAKIVFHIYPTENQIFILTIMKHHPISLEELKKRAHPIFNVNVEHLERLSSLKKVALWITNKVGSMGFFLIIFAWTIGWLTWNTVAPKLMRFDPYPAFVLWLFISNMIQIFLMPLIMVGQNLQSDHAELRAQSDFEINKKSEMEIEAILMHLENHDELLRKIITLIESSNLQDMPNNQIPNAEEFL